MSKPKVKQRTRKPALTPRITNPPQPFSDEELGRLYVHHEHCGNDCEHARWIETLMDSRDVFDGRRR